jgi:hypothetical protein
VFGGPGMGTLRCTVPFDVIWHVELLMNFGKFPSLAALAWPKPDKLLQHDPNGGSSRYHV